MLLYWVQAWSASVPPCTLQQRGREVILVDRHELAGEETSFGNAGLIESASVFPYMFPRDFAQLLKYALNRSPQVRYRFSDLPSRCRGCYAISLHPSPDRALHSAMAELPLIRRSLVEHEALIAEAGVPELLQKTGWLKLFRSDASPRKRGARARARPAIWRRRRGSRRQGNRRARTQFDRRVHGRCLFAGAGIRSRSRCTGQGLCGALQAKGWTLCCGRCANARAGRRRLVRARS